MYVCTRYSKGNQEGHFDIRSGELGSKRKSVVQEMF